MKFSKRWVKNQSVIWRLFRLSASSNCFEWLSRRTMLSKFAYLRLESGFKLKAGTDFSSPEKFHHIVAHENVQFSAAKNEARSSKNADENAKCLVVKELQLLRHHACSKIVNLSIRPCPNKIASKLEIRLLPIVLFRAQEWISEQAFNWSLIYKIKLLIISRD